MPQLIKDRRVVEDTWTLVPDGSSADSIPAEAAIVPLALWQAERDRLSKRADVGVWLKPADDPDALASDVANLPLIAIEFPKFGDGRGYSTARLLREKHHFKGELRAIGDILRDQLHGLEQCGFNSFALRADRDLIDALQSFNDFRDTYQATVKQPLPLFRRRLVASPTGRDPVSQ